MITYTKGNIFYSSATAIVNPVNTIGTMGAGLAAQFKKRYPKNFQLYVEHCKKGLLKPGGIYVTSCDSTPGALFVINFATKDHWHNPSRLEWIVSGLKSVQHFLVSEGIDSIAIPALGAGLGGLPWKDVKKAIDDELGGISLADIRITVFEPNQTKHKGINHEHA